MLAMAGNGTVCVAKVPVATSGEKSLSNATASGTPYDFTVSFNGAPPLQVSHEHPVPAPDLALTARHLVQISQAGQPKESFRFRFSDHSTDRLCLRFNALYETWSLTSAGAIRDCQCDRPVTTPVATGTP